ncbi:MAG: methyltransferase [Alphaproteobacteria bacterium]
MMRFSSRTLDRIEKILVAAFGLAYAAAYLRGYIVDDNIMDLLQVVTEGTMVGFVLFRRPTEDVSRKPSDWILAWGGTLSRLCARPVAHGIIAPLALTTLILLLGFFLQMWAKFTLRRSFGIVAANRGIRASGPYRLLRHPMYAGYFIIDIGAFLANCSLWNFIAYSLSIGIQTFRLLAEERVLSADPEYQALKARVPFRVIPGVF